MSVYMYIDLYRIGSGASLFKRIEPWMIVTAHSKIGQWKALHFTCDQRYSTNEAMNRGKQIFNSSRSHISCNDYKLRYLYNLDHAGHTRKASRISKTAVDNCGKGVGNFYLS